jgi:hypothetical protein
LAKIEASIKMAHFDAAAVVVLALHHQNTLATSIATIVL